MGRSATYLSVVAPTQVEKPLINVRACPISFGTKRGLSTHERHAHTVVRNLKRRGAEPPKSRYWTAVEISLLKELDELYKDYCNPNIEISKILTTKTVEQIKNKRKYLKTGGEDTSSQEACWATEGGCDQRLQRVY